MVASLLASSATAKDDLLLLEVDTNGFPIAKVGEFVRRDGVLMARPSELRALGLRAADNVGDIPVPLSGLAGVAAEIDEATQSLHLTAAVTSLIPTRLGDADPVAGGSRIASGTGATLDYDLSGSVDGRSGNSFGGLFDARVFAPWGVVSSGALVNAGRRPGGGGASAIVRLDTSYTYADETRQLRYRAGDFITDSVAWGRAIRLAGLQIVSDFSMRPDLITFPLPRVSGTASVPSTIDVLVNGNRLFSGAVAAGPFEIPRLPVISGAGTIALTVTDALGRSVVTTLPFYAEATQLAPRLQTWSAQVGAVRHNFGALSDDYGQLAATANYRRGLSQWLTVEASAEATHDTALAGAGVVVNVANVAQVTGSVAASMGSGGTGAKLSLGLQRIGTMFTLGASATIVGRQFRDVASSSGDPTTRLQLTANAGLTLGSFGTLGIAFLDIERDAGTRAIRVYGPTVGILGDIGGDPGGIDYLQPAEKIRIASASYSVQIDRMSVAASAFRDFGPGRGFGVMLGLTLPLGPRTSVGVNGGVDRGGRFGQVQLNRSISDIGDWGYQAFASTGATSHEFGEVQYKAPWALFTAGIDRISRQTTGRGEMQGSLSVLDGGFFASNTITDSFAVVDTRGLAGVRVLHENRAAGRTNSAGQLLVADLRAYEANRLAIDPTDIPLDSSIATTTRLVRPGDRSGIIVTFDVDVSHGALLTFVDQASVPIPLGSAVTLVTTGVVYPVGYDGAAYLEQLQPNNRVTIQLPDDRRCTVSFSYQPIAGDVPAIGPLVCAAKAP